MKKRISFFVVLLLMTFLVYILSNHLLRKDVSYYKVVDGDSFYLYIDNKKQECRLIGIDTPEINDKYGVEAKKYTEKLLKEADKIVIENDINTNKYDKYGRLLVWLFIDDELLQVKLLNEGLAQVKYVYGNYKYIDECYNAQEKAMKMKLNMYTDEKQ